MASIEELARKRQRIWFDVLPPKPDEVGRLTVQLGDAYEEKRQALARPGGRAAAIKRARTEVELERLMSR